MLCIKFKKNTKWKSELTKLHLCGFSVKMKIFFYKLNYNVPSSVRETFFADDILILLSVWFVILAIGPFVVFTYSCTCSYVFID